jgi:hypothetical protein
MEGCLRGLLFKDSCQDAMKRILREPLFHFLLLGAAIFVVFGFTANRSSDEPGEIVVTRGQIEHLATAFAKTWQRAPTAEELTGLIRDRVREEIYCREAIALGLDKDDTVIRRRLRQKMEFISDDIITQSEPTDADLNEYLKAHPESFRIEPRITFQQVYLNPQKHGENLARYTMQLLGQLKRAGSPEVSAKLGDPSMLEHRFAGATATEIARQFGERFAARLTKLTPGQWQGPVESGYGTHLVFLSERIEGSQAVLADVRDEVRREWENTRRLEANEKFYRELLNRYTVTVEGLEPAAAQEQLAASGVK